jgi:hypothetical protein
VDGYVVVREKVKILISFTNAVMVQMFLHYVENAVTAPTLWNYTHSQSSHKSPLCDEKLYQTLLELCRRSGRDGGDEGNHH